MPIVLAALSALGYGTADFLGGLGSRRASALSVTFLAQLAGLPLTGLAVLLFAAARPSSIDVAWGALAGAVGASGLALFYRGLAVGKIGLVAPIAAVVGAGVPVLFGLLGGERPGLPAAAGIGLALVAILLLGSANGALTAAGRSGRPMAGLPQALGSGLAFGAFFVLLDRTNPISDPWPLLISRGVGLLTVATLGLAGRRRLRPGGGADAVASIAGLVDALAGLFFLAAIRGGLLSVVAVVTSLYPATTVLLAFLFLGERMTRLRLLGLACAVAALALIASG